MKQAAALLLIALLFASCRTPGFAPARLDPDDVRPAAVMNSLAQRAAARRSLRAALKLSLDAPDLHFRRPQRLALERPAQMRVEILGLFGQIAALLVTNGENWQYFDASTGEVESGVIAPNLLWDLARVDLTPGETVDLLLGAPTPSPDWVRAGAFEAAGGGLSVELRDSSGALRQRLEFGAESELRVVETWGADEVLAWRADFSDHRPISDTAFAHRVVLLSSRVDARAEFKFEHVELNPELPASLFVLKPGAKAER